MSTVQAKTRSSYLAARAEPMIWITGGALVVCLLLVAGLLFWVASQGLATFQVRALERVTLKDGRVLMGEVTREETWRESPQAPPIQRRQLRTGNYELNGTHFTWVREDEVQDTDQPREAVLVERREWGRFYGFVRSLATVDYLDAPIPGRARGKLANALRRAPEDPSQKLQLLVGRNVDNYSRNPKQLLVDPKKVRDDDQILGLANVTTQPALVWQRFAALHEGQLELHEQATQIRDHEVGATARELTDVTIALVTAKNELRPPQAWFTRYRELLDASTPEQLARPLREDPSFRSIEKRFGTPEESLLALLPDLESRRLKALLANRQHNARIQKLSDEMKRHLVCFDTARENETAVEAVVDVVRMFRPNHEDVPRTGIYLSRVGEFLLDDPRQAGAEGGVFPAIFGTVLMTLLMCIVVVPFGVMAALYLHEYAKKGFIISMVRIAVNNLAGVPSIVFGVFGLGFFCYIVGVRIDELLFADRVEATEKPMFGTGGILWASLTLALMTLPVVIVATEEALAAVPNSMRDGSYACGATKWQTIRRIVLPHALPGIMTGAILAMARGAGEVAPLMLVGAVKHAPSLPLSPEMGEAFGVNKSFMHLGFHIFDLGFQSQNSEASKPMVFTTTLLLISIIAGLNITAIWLRSRLRRRFQSSHF